jgi:hypothetical protein
MVVHTRAISGTNRIHLVLFGIKNRTSGPYLTAINGILISLVCANYNVHTVYNSPNSNSQDTPPWLSSRIVCLLTVPCGDRHKHAYLPASCFFEEGGGVHHETHAAHPFCAETNKQAAQAMLAAAQAASHVAQPVLCGGFSALAVPESSAPGLRIAPHGVAQRSLSHGPHAAEGLGFTLTWIPCRRGRRRRCLRRPRTAPPSRR